VRAMQRNTGPDADGRVERVRGDVLDPCSIARAMAGCDTVYHLAAYAHAWARSPETFFDVNVTGTRSVLEAALRHGVRRVVVTSSVVTMGSAEGEAANESTPRSAPALTPYEESKIAAEEAALEYARRGLQVVIVNPTRVFGPGILNEVKTSYAEAPYCIDKAREELGYSVTPLADALSATVAWLNRGGPREEAAA
ncbi:MAG TPA: NAD-dependent epimerase/dehydratase family protein, partial [Bacteroidota bacterium]|nr:NAD-dependent epimerase/dehydratase family protein [Bacteroidota bacterium]